MADTDQNGRKNFRMDRIERSLEMLIADHVKFSDEHSKLLTAQVLLTDRVDKLAGSVQELRDAQKTTDEQMKGTDERLGILIKMMDTFISERGAR
jgi:hypothetical protein